MISYEELAAENARANRDSGAESARKMVVFSCISLKYTKKSLCQAIISATTNGADCVVYVREPSIASEMLGHLIEA